MIKIFLLLFYGLITFAVLTTLLLTFKSWLVLLIFPVLIAISLKLRDKPFQHLYRILVYILKLVKKTIKEIQIGTKKIIISKTNIQIVILIAILFVVSLSYITQLPIRLEWNKEQEYKKRLEEIRNVKQPKKITVNPTLSPQRHTNQNTGYVRISPLTIQVGKQVTLEYGYKDPLNNEHLQTAVTTATVETPSKKRYSTISAKVYPDDFPGASSSEVGTYWVNVERTIETTNGTIDTLYTASSLFIVNEK